MGRRKLYRWLVISGTFLFCFSSVYGVLQISEQMLQQQTIVVKR